MVSAAAMGPGRGLLALHSLPPPSPSQIQAGLSAGKAGTVPVSSGHRWLRGQEQREGRKWQLPQPSPQPTAWAEGRIGLVPVCQGALGACE